MQTGIVEMIYTWSAEQVADVVNANEGSTGEGVYRTPEHDDEPGVYGRGGRHGGDLMLLV